MKKFLLSLCMIAVASVCVFSITSCKDDDEAAMQNSKNVSGTFEKIINDEIAQGVSYTFELDGTTYNNWADAKAALAALPAGNHTFKTTMMKDGQVYQGNPVTFTVSDTGAVTFGVDVPLHDALHSNGAKITITPAGHSGGAGTVA